MADDGSAAPVARRLLAEFIGTAFLLAAIVGSGAMAENLAHDEGIVLLINAIAVAGALLALILALGTVSGAHLNPVVTLAEAAFRGIGPRLAIGYVGVQVAGAIVGSVVANAMFDQALFGPATNDRADPARFLAEVVATFGLVVVVFGVVLSGRSLAAAPAVAGYIAAAFFFTSSTSFANPAVTIGRMFTDSFTGIAPASAPAFIAAELTAVAFAVVVVRVLWPGVDARPPSVLVPRQVEE